MWDRAGLVRTGQGLRCAHAELTSLERQLQRLMDSTPSSDPGPGDVRSWGEARNMLLIARLITSSALRRTESRGAHYRRDFPEATGYTLFRNAV